MVKIARNRNDIHLVLKLLIYNNMTKKLIYTLIIAFLLVSCVEHKEKQETSQPEETTQTTDSDDLNRQFLVQIGEMAPDFEIEFPNGTKSILSSLRGKVIMLQFTASWCGVCRKEMPHIEKEIWQKHKDNPNFVLWGIDREEPASKIKELAKTTGVTYPIGLDPDASIFGLYAEKDAGITRNVIIDKDGKIAMLTRLFEEEEFNNMVELIYNLLAE